MYTPQPLKKRRRKIDITQGAPKQGGFKRGYQSFVSDSRMPIDALADLTNMTLDQDNLPRPRPSLVLMGEQPLGTVIGASTFIKIVSGLPEKWDIQMQVIAGVGKIHVRKDGEAWVAATGVNTYSSTAIVNFCQTNDRVYVSNGVDAMSYYDIDLGETREYTALSAPGVPTATGTGLTGTNYTYYYRITANNAVGETNASVADSEQVSTPRDSWVAATQYITITWSAVIGAVSYSIYAGDVAGNEQLLTTTTGVTFKDDGTLRLNTFVRAPSGNSTEGPKLSYMINKDGQLYGLGDTDNPSYLWFDGGAGGTGDFSPFNGGGNASINPGGDTIPVSVKSYRTGKGDPAITILSRGVAGAGKMHHFVFTQTVFDNELLQVPNVQEANGQAGTVSAEAVVEYDNSLHYPTGQDFRSTGTLANLQNILSSKSTANDIQPDARRLRLSAMDKSVGLVYENQIFWALPVNSDENNQIWVKDMARRGIWIMPWTINAKFMWLSENNITGQISHCVYDGTNVLEFSRSVATQDNGIAFTTRTAHEGLVWDDNGMTMAAIQEQRFKLLQPSGAIQFNVFGLDEDGAVNTLASETFTQISSFTGWNSMEYSDDDPLSLYSDDVGMVDYVAQAVRVVTLEVDETLNQLGWEVITNTVGCDFFLSTAHTNGIRIDNLYFGS
jgi:hypothetical protein